MSYRDYTRSKLDLVVDALSFGDEAGLLWYLVVLGDAVRHEGLGVDEWLLDHPELVERLEEPHLELIRQGWTTTDSLLALEEE